MKQTLKWIHLWILTVLALMFLVLTYLYLSHDLHIYAFSIVSISSIVILIPYSIWKYKQIKFVDKKHIIIQILND